jgi:hypothetical protein
MIEYQATINGLDQLQRQLAQAPGLVLSEVVKATNVSLANYHRTARELAPIDKGPLRNSITLYPAKAEGTKVTGAVGTNMKYAAAQEGGSGIYGPTGRPIRPKRARVLAWKQGNQTHFATSVKGVKGRFYMKGSLERNQPNTDKAFKQAADNVADAITKGAP